MGTVLEVTSPKSPNKLSGSCVWLSVSDVKNKSKDCSCAWEIRSNSFVSNYYL